MTRRLRIIVRGAVQGVGFRPFCYRLARELRLSGWVMNTPEGVLIEAEGPPDPLREFLLRLEPEAPPHAHIQSCESLEIDPAGSSGFDIRPSEISGTPSALILPDIATCPDCLADITDPANRRYRYPFTNCTNCGPRFSIILSLPYDRPNTTMRAFPMCPECRREYEDPIDRRFHAQPIACPACGPVLSLWRPDGTEAARADDALLAAAEGLRKGAIVALKGLGGFQLLVDARNENAVRLLRSRKHREEKPFALMAPSLALASELCEISPLEARLLRSPESPITLLRRRISAGETALPIAPSVAPNNPFLGVMLPYTPLHHLLLRELGFPLVATSGNLSDDPLCIDEREALSRLGGIADLFLVHNRPIHRHVDDSIVRVLLDREAVLRRARGYAPLPVRITTPLPEMLAVGAHLKSTVAVSRGRDLFVSQHLGDLESAESLEAFRRESAALQSLYRVAATRVVSDLHPDYLSTRHARETGLRVTGIQHHWAHLCACAAENCVEGDFLGVSWDGTGYGTDGSVWGGEFLLPAGETFVRGAHLRTFLLPGSDQAVRQPRRAAAGVLFALHGPGVLGQTGLHPVSAFSQEERDLLARVLAQRINSPVTSSAGRLFDAVASILGLRQECTFEGQAAMELEFLADRGSVDGEYEIPLRSSPGTPSQLDWGPMIDAILSDLQRGEDLPRLARRFHLSLAAGIVKVARAFGKERVVLSGGCFQNRLLTEETVLRLRASGFNPCWHQRIPPNDGGIALGQLVAAGRILSTKSVG